jgi:hypothetical protein
MKHIKKINEFINESVIYSLIEKAERTPFSDLEYISKLSGYREVVNLGEVVIPYLLERNSIIWDIALRELTNTGLSPEEYSTSERVEFWNKWGLENGYKK